MTHHQGKSSHSAKKVSKTKKRGRKWSALLFLLSLTVGVLVWQQNQKAQLPLDTTAPLTDTRSSSDKGALNAQEWNLVLVNKDHYIPKDYQMDLTKLTNGESVDSRIYLDLQNMFDAARQDGIFPTVAAGFRTTTQQQQLVDEKINEYVAQGYTLKQAAQKANTWVAVPGTSEHQLGLSVDINADKEKSTAQQVYDWLAQNAHQYGFILRYPADKAHITGTIYEPWHYRYVGVLAATQIYSRQICLEEYLSQL